MKSKLRNLCTVESHVGKLHSEYEVCGFISRERNPSDGDWRPKNHLVYTNHGDQITEIAIMNKGEEKNQERGRERKGRKNASSSLPLLI